LVLLRDKKVVSVFVHFFVRRFLFNKFLKKPSFLIGLLFYFVCLSNDATKK
jgi:hypothetical protein